MSQTTTARLLGQLLTAHQAAIWDVQLWLGVVDREWSVTAAKTMRKDN
jgi:hypothetical protein